MTDVGLQQIINIRASMNLGLSDLQKSEFINYKPVPRPIIKYTEIPNPNWIAGFSSAEGCFLLTISKSNNNKIGKIVQLIFKISQHHRDKILLELRAKFFNCGAVAAKMLPVCLIVKMLSFGSQVGKFVDCWKIAATTIIRLFLFVVAAKAFPIQGIK